MLVTTGEKRKLYKLEVNSLDGYFLYCREKRRRGRLTPWRPMGWFREPEMALEYLVDSGRIASEDILQPSSIRYYLSRTAS